MRTRKVTLVFKETVGHQDAEIVDSGITAEPYRLWLQHPNGSRTYVMMDSLIHYTFGLETGFPEKNE